jgi:Peptidase family M50
MTGLQVYEVILPESDYQSSALADIVAGVQRFAREMNQRGIPDAALPPNVLQSSCVEYYCNQVQNGNIGQFVTNSRWSPKIVAGARAGLAAIGLKEQLALFEDVVRFVETTSKELDAALKSNEPERKGAIIREGQRFQVMGQAVIGKYDDTEFGRIIAEAAGEGRDALGPRESYRRKLDAIRGGFFKAFTAHADGYVAGCEQIRVANANWIRSWANIRLVSLERYRHELDRLAQFSCAGGTGKLPPFVAPAGATVQKPLPQVQQPPTEPLPPKRQTPQQPPIGLRGPKGIMWPLAYVILFGLAMAPPIANALSLQVPKAIMAAYPYASKVTVFILICWAANLIYHFVTALTAFFAKAPISEFSLGFGPELFSYATRSLRFRLAALLLGGYVKWSAVQDINMKTVPLRLLTTAIGPASLLVVAWIILGRSPLIQASTVLAGMADIVLTRDTSPAQFWAELIYILKSKTWLESLAYFSMIGGVLNLLPLPFFNGGQLVLVLIEKTMSRQVSERIFKMGAPISSLAMLGFLGILLWELVQFLKTGG